MNPTTASVARPLSLNMEITYHIDGHVLMLRANAHFHDQAHVMTREEGEWVRKGRKGEGCGKRGMGGWGGEEVAGKGGGRGWEAGEGEERTSVARAMGGHWLLLRTCP